MSCDTTLVEEKDCHQLGNAGHLARKKGIIPKGQSLTCPHTECDQIDCILVTDPPVRTIYIASAQTPTETPQDKFYGRLQKHVDMVTE